MGAAVAATLSGLPAFAGPYLNVERTQAWVGDNSKGSYTDFHAGFEGPAGEDASWYIQGGASYLMPTASQGDSTTVPSAKAGLLLEPTGPIDIYGEFTFRGSGDVEKDKTYKAEIGIKYDL